MSIPKKHEEHLQKTLEGMIKYANSNRSPGMSNISEITQHVSLSDLPVSTNIAQLRANAVEAILYLGDDNKPPKVLQAYKKKKIAHKYVQIEDSPKAPIGKVFEDCYNFIHVAVAAEKRVLVHCAAGVSRSPTVIIYYLLKRYYMINYRTTTKLTKQLVNYEKYFAPDVLEMVKDARPCVCPNPGFLKVLLMVEYQMKVMFERSIREEFAIKYGSLKKILGDNGNDVDSDDDDCDPVQDLEEMINILIDGQMDNDPEDMDDSDEELPKKRSVTGKGKNKVKERSTIGKGKHSEPVYDKLEDLAQLFSNTSYS
jgi:predicted protein tyrosine phosphatase